jgi:predicted nucleic acid-binding Zn ribbon protein
MEPCVMDDDQLRTVWQQRQFDYRISHLSEPLTVLMRHTLGKRVRQLSKLAVIWDEVVPQLIREHTALESFQRGVLTVLVDSASHRFQLQLLLADGLLAEIQQRFNGPLDRIKLVPGQFYAVELTPQRSAEL